MAKEMGAERILAKGIECQEKEISRGWGDIRTGCQGRKVGQLLRF